MPPHDLAGDKKAAKRGHFASMQFSVVLLGFFVIAGVLLFTEHRAHALGALFYVLPLVCLFMHMFMHGGHGNHARHDHERNAP